MLCYKCLKNIDKSSKNNEFNSKNIIAVDVYLEKIKSKAYVGQLKFFKDKYIFKYQKAYIYSKNPLALGPDLPLTKKIHESKILFLSLQDRIPSKENPAYSEYCESEGITKDEKNPLVLLATIGKRGPSSFIFEPVFKQSFTGKDLAKYRHKLDLTIREFAAAFDISNATIQNIEKGKSSGKDILKRVAIYHNFPIIALHEIEKSAKLHYKKKLALIKKLRQLL
jgi:HipA-like protein